jgi:TPR repeat protein
MLAGRPAAREVCPHALRSALPAAAAPTAPRVRLPLPAPTSARISVHLSSAAPRRWFAGDAGGAKGTAISWLSAKISKRISKMGALETVRKAADKGDVQAMTLMGVCYAMGRDVEQNDAVAAEWFRKAADGGNPEGALALGNWILEGRGGLTKDPAEAARLVELASSKGVQEAHGMLGVLYTEGAGVKQNHTRAAALFEQAAAGGDLKALYNFGCLQIEGKGMQPSQSKGMECVRRAATGGVAEAQFTVSIWYRDGSLGTKRDAKKAFDWALKAAKLGHAQVSAFPCLLCTSISRARALARSVYIHTCMHICTYDINAYIATQCGSAVGRGGWRAQK